MSSPAILVVTADTAIAGQVLACVEGTGCRVRMRDGIANAIKDLEKAPGIALMLLDGSLATDNALARIRSVGPGADLPVLVLDSAAGAASIPLADAVIPHPLHSPTIRAWVHMAERLWALANAQPSNGTPRDDRTADPLLRTASLSHAVASPLQNICAAIDLLAISLPPDCEELEQLEAIRHHVHRTAEIVRAASEEARHALKPAGHDG